ncbi:oxidoreductase, partial [Rhizobium ruizarguesonis]
VGRALIEAHEQNPEIHANGIDYGRAAEAVRGVQWRHMALATEAVLGALDFFIRNGGGSRGARAICDVEGVSLPLASSGALQDYRFRKVREAHREEQI